MDPTAPQARTKSVIAFIAVVLAIGAVALLPSTSAIAITQQPAAGQQPQVAHAGPIVTVSGEGRVAVTPDRAVLSLGATAQAETAVQAQNTVNSTVRRATDAINKLDIEGLVVQTSRVSLNPVFDFQNRRDRNAPAPLVGYTASLSINVRMDDIASVSTVIDAAMQQGINQMNGLSFTLADDTEQRQRALAESVHAARAKAQTIAQALGVELGELLEVQEAGTVTPVRPPGAGARTMSMEAVASVPTPIEAGELEITARVQLTYRLAD